MYAPAHQMLGRRRRFEVWIVETQSLTYLML
jgi:hypothetical protein